MGTYYLKTKYAELMINPDKIRLENLHETHVKMPVLFPITVKTPDEVFSILNGESYIANPLCISQNQRFIHENGTHTSMSVGDIVEINGIYYLCEDIGWKILR